jgi:PHS family inorganic phosphate transporter-like MFS transporter
MLHDFNIQGFTNSVRFATTKWRGAMMGSVFAMQGFGQVAAGLVALICVAGFKDSLETAVDYKNCSGGCQVSVDKMWRIIVGFGAVPGCIALYYRLTIPETPRYTFDVAKDVVKAQDDITAYIAGKPEGNPDEITRIQAAKEAEEEMDIPKASWSDFMRHYSKWRYGRVLIGTAGSWFLLDIAYYGLSLNTTLLLESIGYTDSGAHNVYQKFYNTAVGNLIIVCAGAVPGYWFTALFCDRVGRKPIQIGGFALLTIILAVLGFADKSLSINGKFALYVIAEFFLNFGKRADRQGDTPYPAYILSRTQRDDLHNPRRVLPDSIQKHIARNQCGRRKTRSGHCAGDHRTACSQRRTY